MAITLFSTDVENISHLSDLPNEEEGLTAAALKAVFDKAGKDIKDFINTSLIPEIDATIGKAFTVTFPSGSTTYDYTTSSYGLNSNSIIFCQPADGYSSLWNSCGIKCASVTTNKLTFTATTAPSSNVNIQVFVMN